MGIVFQSDFNSDTVGSTPAGWTNTGGGGAQVFNFGVPPPSTPVPGGPNHCVGLNGSIASTFSPTDNGILSFGYSTTERNPLAVMMNLKSTGPGGTFNLLTLQLEHDFSFSAICPSGFLVDLVTLQKANSNIVSGMYTYPNKFDFFQVLFIFIENGDHSIQASITLIINGQQVFDATANTGLFTTTDCPANAQTIEFVNDTIGFPGAFLDNVVVDNDPISGYPFPGNPTTFYDFTSQLAFEHLDLPDDTNIKMSQLAFERISLPSDQKIRMSQVVIEVIQSKNAVPTGSGWSVKEM